MEENQNLPPLKKEGKSHSQEIFKDDLDPQTVKRRVLRDFSIIQNLDKDLAATKQSLPQNLNKMLLQIRQETQRLIETETPTLTPEQAEEFKDLLKNFEEKLVLKAD